MSEVPEHPEGESSRTMMLLAQLGEKKDSVKSEIGALSQQLKELRDRLQQVEEKDKWFREKLDFLSKEINTEQQRYQSLTEQVSEVKQKAKELKSEIKKTDKSISSTQDRIKEFKKQLADIEEERKICKGDYLIVDYCRIACYFEHALCSHVLPEVFVNEQDPSVHALLDYLNGNDRSIFPLDSNKYNCEKILSDARERWDIMCEKLDLPSEWKKRAGGWKVWDCMIPPVIRAMDILRLGRNILDGSKPVSLKFAEENLSSVEDDMPSWQFELVASFIGSLRENMVKSALHHKHLLLD